MTLSMVLALLGIVAISGGVVVLSLAKGKPPK